MPAHLYEESVSYFSSKAPRVTAVTKPDTEQHIPAASAFLSCAARENHTDCVEDEGGEERGLGTSMAAPHVSGAIAATAPVSPRIPYRAAGGSEKNLYGELRPISSDHAPRFQAAAFWI